MFHYKGWQDAVELNSTDFWDKSGGIEDEKKDRLVLAVGHPFDKYYLVADYHFRLINLILKNQIRYQHKINFEVLDENNQHIDC